ncbi:MAG: hypothetical protein MJ088_06305, partial [Clostridia bacterium]|nr:hypothetical protein [Clostridia bacterium]
RPRQHNEKLCSALVLLTNAHASDHRPIHQNHISGGSRQERKSKRGTMSFTTVPLLARVHSPSSGGQKNKSGKSADFPTIIPQEDQKALGS